MEDTDTISNFNEVIGLWGTVTAFSRDTGIPENLSKSYKARNSLPAHWWKRVVAAAEARGFVQITFEKLAEIAALKGQGSHSSCSSQASPAAGVNAFTENVQG
jgi:hypothetical protein